PSSPLFPYTTLFRSLVHDVVAVHEHVHGLADARHGERIEAAVLELGAVRVERQLGVGTERKIVGEERRSFHPLEQGGVAQRVRIQMNVANFKTGDGLSLCRLPYDYDLVQPRGRARLVADRQGQT